MYLVPLSSILESVASSQATKNLSGNVKNPDVLFSADALRNLEIQHNGIYALMVFIAGSQADKSVSRYIAEGSIGDDAGGSVMVLFTLNKRIAGPTKMTSKLIVEGVIIEPDQHPVYRFARDLFPSSITLQYPGVLVCDKLSSPTECAYVTLADCANPAEVRMRCTYVFAAATSSYKKHVGGSPSEAMSELCARFADHGIQYVRTGKTSLCERISMFESWTRKNGWTIATLLSSFVPKPHLGE